MREISSPLDGFLSPFGQRRGGFSPLSLFASGEEGTWLDTSDISTLFQDSAGTTPVTASGQTIGFVKDKSGNELNATQATTAARPSYIVDADGAFIQHDPVDDALTVTFPDLGTEATVAYVTRSEVRLLEDQTISGSYTLPAQELANFVVIDRALTLSEKIRLIRYLAGKVEGVNYGAEIDRLTLIAVNAVDVFVYDTSRDSDGGAWRTGALAQASSWYNETLNTATRGSRREFPQVAVIVVEDTFVTVYDGDDPTLPMWATLTNAYPAYSATYNSSVYAVNGVVCIGGNAGYGGLAIVNFPAAKNTWHGYGQGGYAIGVYVQENWTTTTDRPDLESATRIGGAVLVNSFVNDVAMTVLPDAPTDPATGLPVPTIAVATDGGVSVIKDDGTVVDSAATLTMGQLFFDDTGGLFYQRNVTTGILWYSTRADYEAGDGFGDEIGRTTFGTNNFDILAFSEDSGNSAWLSDSFALGGDVIPLLGLMHHQPNYTDQSKGMSALLTSTYATGWMPGDIKGAFLADTDDTALVGGTDADRSVNGNDLTVNGTITRTPVASGADLVAYSGFSVSNYLEGTDASYVDTLYALGWEQTGGVWEFNHGAVSTAPIDGLTITGTTLKIAGTKPKALIRLTATTPSAEQLAKIEADEGALFQENAQATLYGASDAVTALAHDPVTDLLHVGTSAGRSIFEGLRRVGNTTTSVSTAISASGGLVVEK